ncbi:MAG: long-chain fatty acid--CoA ligase [Verrucomicrobia bacterium]|nr:long-chain fatty acid--CoA ligase [Verrucomicrobiota bacterium]
MEKPTRVFDLLRYQLSLYPKTDAFACKVNGVWKTVSTAAAIEIADSLAWGLHLLGIRKGDRIANVAETNRPEWNYVDTAVMTIGAIHVPIYPNISADEFLFILGEAEARLIFVSSERLYELMTPLARSLPSLLGIYTYGDEEVLPNWSTLVKSGREGLKQNDRVLKTISHSIESQDIATLIYTSGTSGKPKGVLLSHANLMSNMLSCEKLFGLGPADRALSFLPLCHSYERTVINLLQYRGTSIYYAENLNKVGENLREVRPKIITTVPRLLEKIYEKFLLRGNELTGFRRSIFFWALDIAENFDPAKPGSLRPKLKRAVADLLVYKRLRQALGGRLRVIISGSAALQPRLARIFWAAGIPVYEGYGPTEAAPVISVNYPGKGNWKVGTVGPVIPNGEVKIASDGEILYRGPNVMVGYYGRQDLTAETIDKEGWLHTGDVGDFDGKFLKITDRKKEIFKTSGGKYIAPQQVENVMKESKFISQVMIVGENEKFPAALIVPSFESLRASLNGEAGSFDSDVVSNADLVSISAAYQVIQDEVSRLNERLARYAQVKKFRLLPQEWSVAGGELTPTMKLRRKDILRKYADEVKSIYDGTK